MCRHLNRAEYFGCIYGNKIKILVAENSVSIYGNKIKILVAENYMTCL